MALVTPNLAFFHIPRSGGTWVRLVLSEMLGLPVEELGLYHCTPDDLEPSNRYTFTVTREPLPWMASMWTAGLFQMGKAATRQFGIPPQTLLRDLPCTSWYVFLNAYLDQDKPLVTQAFEPYTAKVDHVGTTYDLTGGVLHALEAIIRRYDAVPVNRTPPPNDRRITPARLSPWTEYQRLRAVEIEGCRSACVTTSGDPLGSGRSQGAASTLLPAGKDSASSSLTITRSVPTAPVE